MIDRYVVEHADFLVGLPLGQFANPRGWQVRDLELGYDRPFCLCRSREIAERVAAALNAYERERTPAVVPIDLPDRPTSPEYMGRE